MATNDREQFLLQMDFVRLGRIHGERGVKQIVGEIAATSDLPLEKMRVHDRHLADQISGRYGDALRNIDLTG